MKCSRWVFFRSNLFILERQICLLNSTVDHNMNWNCQEVVTWCKSFINDDSILARIEGQLYDFSLRTSFSHRRDTYSFWSFLRKSFCVTYSLGQSSNCSQQFRDDLQVSFFSSVVFSYLNTFSYFAFYLFEKVNALYSLFSFIGLHPTAVDGNCLCPVIHFSHRYCCCCLYSIFICSHHHFEIHSLLSLLFHSPDGSFSLSFLQKATRIRHFSDALHPHNFISSKRVGIPNHM